MLILINIVQDERGLLRSHSSLDIPGEPFGRISIFYNTSWERVYLHGSINGGEWRDHQFQKVSLCLTKGRVNQL